VERALQFYRSRPFKMAVAAVGVIAGVVTAETTTIDQTDTHLYEDLAAQTTATELGGQI
jgi:hypothetical protein